MNGCRQLSPARAFELMGASYTPLVPFVPFVAKPPSPVLPLPFYLSRFTSPVFPLPSSLSRLPAFPEDIWQLMHGYNAILWGGLQRV